MSVCVSVCACLSIAQPSMDLNLDWMIQPLVLITLVIAFKSYEISYLGIHIQQIKPLQMTSRSKTL